MADDSILIAFVLDRSASMAVSQTETIDGFNEYKKGQAALPGECLMSITLFNHRIEHMPAVPVAQVPDLTPSTYVPDGSTSLWDAIGETVKRTQERLDTLGTKNRPGKILFVVLTDGQENTSKNFNKKQVLDLKLEMEHAGWQFVFLGVGIDAFVEGSQFGMTAGTTRSFVGGAPGVAASYNLLSSSTAQYRSMGPSGQSVTNFFDQYGDDSQSVEAQSKSSAEDE